MSSFSPTSVAAGEEKTFVRAPITGDGAGPSPSEFRPIRAGYDREDNPTLIEKSAEEVREEAYAEGFAAGRGELPWQEVEEVKALSDLLSKALEDVAVQKRAGLQAQRESVVELSIAIAEKLVRSAFAAQPEALVAVIERAIATLPDEGKLRVEVSNEDYAALQEGLPDALVRLGQDGDVEFEASAELARGDVRVSGRVGDVDARVEALLARVHEELMSMVSLGGASS